MVLVGFLTKCWGAQKTEYDWNAVSIDITFSNLYFFFITFSDYKAISPEQFCCLNDFVATIKSYFSILNVKTLFIQNVSFKSAVPCGSPMSEGFKLSECMTHEN